MLQKMLKMFQEPFSRLSSIVWDMI